MKRRYVVLLNSATEEQDKEFMQWVIEQSFNYWHWLDQSWLLVTTSPQNRMAEIREKAKEIYAKCHVLVLVLEKSGNDTWAGYGPLNDKRNMFTWLQNVWRK